MTLTAALKVSFVALSLTSSGALREEIAPAIDGLTYISESDYPVRFDAVPGDTVSVEATLQGFGPQLQAEIFTDGLEGLVGELSSPEETNDYLVRLAYPVSEDPTDVANAERWAKVAEILESNLTDLRLVKIGPADDDGSLAVDAGLYAYLVLGLTDDGHLAGIFFGAVET